MKRKQKTRKRKILLAVVAILVFVGTPYFIIQRAPIGLLDVSDGPSYRIFTFSNGVKVGEFSTQKPEKTTSGNLAQALPGETSTTFQMWGTNGDGYVLSSAEWNYNTDAYVGKDMWESGKTARTFLSFYLGDALDDAYEILSEKVKMYELDECGGYGSSDYVRMTYFKDNCDMGYLGCSELNSAYEIWLDSNHEDNHEVNNEPCDFDDENQWVWWEIPDSELGEWTKEGDEYANYYFFPNWSDTNEEWIKFGTEEQSSSYEPRLYIKWIDRKTKIEQAMDLCLDYIEQCYNYIGYHNGKYCSVMTEFPHYPLCTKDYTASKDMMLGEVGTDDYIIGEKVTYSYSYENYTYSFKNDDWDTPEIWVHATHYAPDVYGKYKTKVQVKIVACDTNHLIDLWLGDEKIFSDCKNQVGQTWSKTYDGGDFDVAFIGGYRYTIRHGTQIARKLMMWYNENIQAGTFSSTWIDQLNNTVAHNDFDDDFYDALALDKSWIIDDDDTDGDPEDLTDMCWNDTQIKPFSDPPVLPADYFTNRLYHDVDIYGDMVTEYPHTNYYGAQPYKSRVSLARSAYYVSSADDCLTWSVIANHGIEMYDEYGQDGFNWWSTEIDDMEDLLEYCNFDGKGMKGGVANLLLIAGGYYTTLRLSSYTMGVTRLCELGEWNDQGHNGWTDAKELISILLKLQWLGEGYVYWDDDTHLVRRNMFRGGFMIAYNFDSPPYYREPGSFAINVAEGVMELLGYYEPLPRNYYGYPICNMETTLITFNALRLFYDLYYS